MVHCDAVGGARREAPPRPPRGQQNSPAVQVIAGLFLCRDFWIGHLV
nr:MAG TPA: hypothetical protein [Caudoviricetes sp.]